uniref:Uncharacterized protein n=1 Tax=Magallana gigas TaxID=29159 RepID=K1RAP1_MAGGI
MNSNLYTASKKFCLHVLTYFLVLNLLISLGTAAPAHSDLSGITPGQGRTEVIQKKMFLRTKSQRALEILKDGTVQGTACGHNTQYCDVKIPEGYDVCDVTGSPTRRRRTRLV